MTGALTKGDTFNLVPTPPRPKMALCNETHLLSQTEICGERFKQDMGHIAPKNLCNLTHFIRYVVLKGTGDLHCGLRGPVCLFL
ncbi:unnamed protein product [Boreogadus saida]